MPVRAHGAGAVAVATLTEQQRQMQRMAEQSERGVDDE